MIKTFTITQRLIENSHPANAGHCALARCMKEGGYTQSWVGKRPDGYVVHPNYGFLKSIIVPNGTALADWLEKYDAGDKVEPIEVELKIEDFS